MKTLNIIPFILALVLLAASAFASDEKYVITMQKNIEVVYTSQSPDEVQNAVNAFDRIGEAEKNKWEPFYYSAFGYVMMANREKEAVKKDSYLDQALKGVERAKALQPNESEVIALEGFIHMMRITVDPASRGQQYSGMALQAFGKAVALNAENPRALMLLAQMQYGMAQFFGSPTTEACGTLAKSLEKFDTFKSENPIAPQWGRNIAEGLKTKCN